VNCAGKVLPQCARMLLLLGGLASFCVLAATPDRTTIPAADRSALAAFARPQAGHEQISVLPDYQFSDGGHTVKFTAAEFYLVREIRVADADVLDANQLAEVLSIYEKRKLSFNDMVLLRDRLTALYVEAGYVTSGAVLQRLEGGVLDIQIIEGALERIDVRSTGHFREQYVADYLAGFGEMEPVNVFDLEERLQILQQQPHVSSVEAQLLPGSQRGESVLLVSPVEVDRWGLGLEASNQLSPAIGGTQLVASLNVLNLTGRADDLRLGARAAEGLSEFMGEYDFPVGLHGQRLALYAFGADSDIVREPFKDLDIGADSLTAGARYRLPIFRSLLTQTHLVLAGEWRQSRTYLLGQGFSFIEGPEDGRARMAIIRGGIESLHRSQRDVLYGRLEVSLGLDAFGATVAESDTIPDGSFVKLRGQFQWARRMPWLDSELLLRIDGQLADDPLFGLEQYPIGGRWTVRGYRENTLIRDNALIVSAEWRLPLRQDPTGRSRLELRPFVDWSHSSNVSGDEIGPRQLSSVGLGLYWSPVQSLQFEVYWGEALEEVTYAGEYDLQDDGIHFRFTWDASL
jgi:hemolysin activation/secretion protein